MRKMTWVKVRTLQLERTLKDVADEAGYSYSFFIQIINGFKKIPDGFAERLESVFRRWAMESAADERRPANASGKMEVYLKSANRWFPCQLVRNNVKTKVVRVLHNGKVFIVKKRNSDVRHPRLTKEDTSEVRSIRY